ncbi:MAG TPA: DUF2780 domain-containing protein [Steroidobacteraceae bacterium]|jgi:hypothetical protein|nr:DUF2780 domain-containing protein [Steroidobacteraceae bacterium]
MQRRILLPGLILAAITLASCSSTSAPSAMTSALGGSNPLMGMLTSQLGVTQQQAEGGVGSILKLANEKMARGDFDQVAALIPGASKYMDTARKLGAYAGQIGDLAGLTSSLGKLGISPDTAASFIPAVTDFVGKAGGSELGGKLAAALKQPPSS